MFTFTILAPTLLRAQESESKLYRIHVKDFSQIRDIESTGISVYNRKPGEWIEVLARPEQMQKLNINGVTVEFIAESFKDLYRDALDLKSVPPFHGYQNTLDELKRIHASYPDITRLVTIGLSNKGRAILCLKISDNPGVDEDEPPLLFLGAHHGNEVHSVEIPLYQINYLCDNYGVDPEVTAWVNNMEIWYVPMVNPDGREAMQRGNDHGVDLNRNYSFGFTPGGGHGPSAFSEPETRAIRDFTAKYPPIMSLSYHTSAQYVLYSWTHTDASAPDSAAMIYLGGKVSEATTIPGGHYSLVQGGRWYFTAGEYCDYMYVNHNTLAFTVELGLSQAPDYSVVPEMNIANLNGWKTMVRQASKAGVTGLVTDAGTGVPVPATIEIPQINDQGKLLARHADSQYGRYYRYLVPGTYTFQISAPGYRTVIKDVTIYADSLTHWDIKMDRAAFLEVSQVVLSDKRTASTSGNGDGKVNVGEMVGFSMTLNNVQSIRASKVYAKIGSDNPNIRFFRDSIYFGNIEGDKSKTSADTALFRIDPNTPDGEILDLRISISDSAGFGWLEHSEVEAFTPELDIAKISIDDSNGNGNGAFDNGETVTLGLKVSNDGRQGLHVLSAVITTSDTFFTIVSDQDEADELGEGGDHTFYFQVSLPPGAPKGYLAGFHADISSAEGCSTSIAFKMNNINGFYDDFEKGENGWVHASYGTSSNAHDDWQLGTPAGKAGDPGSAWSGVNCRGNNMGWDSYAGTSWDGSYQANQYNYLRSPVIDCSGFKNSGLKFMRWLNVRISDFARIRVNNVVVWENGQQSLFDINWTSKVIDISAIADNNPSVTVVFELQSNSTGTAGGWNIDDVIVGNGLAPGSTSVEALPASVQAVLYDCRPNPFSSQTVISYFIPEGGPVELAIYDQAGNRVRMLRTGNEPSGQHEVLWNGKSDTGRPVPPGIYYYSLKTGKALKTKRMAVLR